MNTLQILLFMIVGTVLTASGKKIDCRAVRCMSPYPCDDGIVVKRGCCSVCIKNEQSDCPPDICNTVKCGVREGECVGENEYIKEGGGTCGCCNACITLLDVDDDCSKPYTECKSRSTCNPVTRKCDVIDPNCPPDVCKRVKCGVRQGECLGENEYIKEGAGICGCCNACITLVDKGEDCSIKTKECKPGSQCNPVTHLCE